MKMVEFFADYICNHSKCWRHLYARPSTEYRSGSTLRDDSIKDFLSGLTKNADDTEIIKTLQYLVQPSLESFIEYQLPQLIKSLTRTTLPLTHINQGGIKGNVDWPKTVLAKRSRSIPNGASITRRSTSTYNTPENQLLALFLNTLTLLITNLERRHGTHNLPSILSSLKHKSIAALKSRSLSEVERISRVTSLHRQRCQRAKNTGYTQLLTFYSQFNEAILESKWHAIANLLNQGWISPIAEDDLYELYSLVRIVDHMEDSCKFGEISSFGLIRHNRSSIVDFCNSNDDSTLSIYFDQSLSVINRDFTPFYNKIVSDSFFQAITPRRPDIILKFNRGGKTKYLFIECKYSTSESYIRDSIYKCFGYIYDYSGLWDDSDSHTKAILLIPHKQKRSIFTSSETGLEIFNANDSCIVDAIVDSFQM